MSSKHNLRPFAYLATRQTRKPLAFGFAGQSARPSWHRGLAYGFKRKRKCEPGSYFPCAGNVRMAFFSAFSPHANDLALEAPG